jgi:dTDP-4-amino-4,6-dideoxygalactose transaminase
LDDLSPTGVTILNLELNSLDSQIQVPYINLALQHQHIKKELLQAVERVLDHGRFILGPEVTEFEREFAAFCGARYAVGVDNGTSALYLSLRAIGVGPGDEVITVPNSFLASASSIALTGARPVFVDVRDDYNMDPELLQAVVTPSTKAILPVHLTGRPADMYPILEVARRNGLRVIEDCAQAVGGRYGGQHVGTFGLVGCFSLHPLKTLNAVGDGGLIITDDETIYHFLLKARDHGMPNRDECEFWSHNCRLDTIQAAMLLVKMKHLDKWTNERRAIAAFYRERLCNLVEVPQDKPNEFAVYHTFMIQTDERNKLQEYLKELGIESLVHNPISIHLQQAARSLGYKPGDFPVAEKHARRVLSLPIFPQMTQAQREHTVRTISQFFAAGG